MAQLNVFQKEPNIYITEEATLPAAPGGALLGIGAMFGVTLWGPVGVPTLVESLGQFERIFGAFISATYPSYKQVKKFFQNGGEKLYYTRVVHYTTVGDPDTKTSVSAIATIVDATSAARVVVHGKYDGAKGNSLSILVEDSSLGISNEFRLTVKLDGAAIEPPYDNLSLDSTAKNYFKTVVNNLSDWVRLEEGTSVLPIDIALSSMATLVGGTNGLTSIASTDYIGDDDALNGIKSFNIIEENLLVACPDADVTTGVLIENEIGRWCDYDRPLNFGIICVPASHSAVAAVSFVDSTLTLDSPRTAIYYPFLKDEDDGEYIAPTGSVMGVFARFANDTGKGPWWSPAGLEAGILGAAGIETKLGSSAAGKLNEKSINVIKITPVGPTIWGARTLAVARARDFRYIGPRLNTSNIELLVLRNTQWAILRPNDAGLWAQITSTVTQILTTRWQAGGLDGATTDKAFVVKCDEETNTPANRAAGIVLCQVGIRNKQTAEFIWFNIAQIGTGGEVQE
jgi:hypothetical protein